MGRSENTPWTEYLEAVENLRNLPSSFEKKRAEVERRQAMELEQVVAKMKPDFDRLDVWRNELDTIEGGARRLAEEHGFTKPPESRPHGDARETSGPSVKARRREVQALWLAIEEGVVAYESAKRTEERARRRDEEARRYHHQQRDVPDTQQPGR